MKIFRALLCTQSFFCFVTIHGQDACDPNTAVAPCQVNVTCALANDFDQERRSVVLIGMGNYAGTGVLVRSCKEDAPPYILTARHNLVDVETGEYGNMADWIFVFNYYNTTCSGSSQPSDFFVLTGASLVAEAIFSDIILIRLFQRPEDFTPVYYAGWNRSQSLPGVVHMMSHPKGAVMKYDRGSDMQYAEWSNLPIPSNFNPPMQIPSPTAAWPTGPYSGWVIENWEFAYAQCGSSGAGLWNSNKELVGILSGGFEGGSCEPSGGGNGNGNNGNNGNGGNNGNNGNNGLGALVNVSPETSFAGRFVDAWPVLQPYLGCGSTSDPVSYGGVSYGGGGGGGGAVGLDELGEGSLVTLSLDVSYGLIPIELKMLEEGQDLQVRILDPMGRLVHEATLNKGSRLVRLANRNLSYGAYLIQVLGDNETACVKMVSLE